MRHENYKSDIALEVTLTLGGVEIPVPDHDFALIFYTTGKRKYTCAHKGDSWDNCKVVGGRLHCYLDNHGLAPGVLRCEFYDYAPDADFDDGDQLKVVPRALDIELIYGAGDDATLISVEVATDVASAIARANAISADLEAKRDSDYYRGVGIASVEQTTTSIESGGENVVTVTLTDGEQSTFSVHNGGSELGNYYDKSQTNALLASKADIVDGKIPVTQLPSYVDDVLDGMYDNGNFYPAIYNPSNPDFIPDVHPYTPESGKLYIDTRYNKAYRWDGSQYVEVAGGGGGGDMSDYYTKTEVDNKIAALPSLKYVVVDNLPMTGDERYVYLVPTGETGNNAYSEFMWIGVESGGALQYRWEKIGSTSASLADYYTKAETDALVAAKYTKPSGGIPATDLAAAVQTSLGKADTAIQSIPEADEIAYSGQYASGSVNDVERAIDDLYANKQDTISDLATIRSGAAAGATAVQPAALASKQDIRTLVTTGSALTATIYVDLGTTDTIAPTLPASPSRADEFVFTFTCVSNAPNITLPQGVALADGFDWSEADAGVQFQVSICDNIAAYLVLTPNT